MARVKFEIGGQRGLINKVQTTFKLKNAPMAELCGVNIRTYSDWKREKYNINYGSLLKLCKISGSVVPKKAKVLPEHWSVEKAGTLGGKRRFELYGAPGTIETRRKGGTISSRKLMANPEWARKIGFVVRKEIKYPEKSPLLAEFIGIMLGDGGIRNNHQISISFNMHGDMAYADYIQNIVTELFGISSKLLIRKDLGSADVVVTGINLVEFLEKLGIKKGNKVKNQVDIPRWIFENKDYQVACLRGLFDTDGCVYNHKYKVNGKEYSFVKLAFTSYSEPLRNSVKLIFENLGFTPKLYRKRVYLYKRTEVDKYFNVVGTHNPRYLHRYNTFKL